MDKTVMVIIGLILLMIFITIMFYCGYVTCTVALEYKYIIGHYESMLVFVSGVYTIWSAVSAVYGIIKGFMEG